MQNSVELTIKLQTLISQEDGIWLAECPSIDVATQAETESAAFAAIDEAVKAWFESCLERGVLREALLESGFTLAKTGELIPEGADRVTVTNGQSSMPVTEKELQISIPAYIASSIMAPPHAIH